jgi:hypothetical protein
MDPQRWAALVLPAPLQRIGYDAYLMRLEERNLLKAALGAACFQELMHMVEEDEVSTNAGVV